MKKNIKKLLIGSTALLLTLALASCGKTADETAETTPEATESAPEATEPAAETTEPAPEATADDSATYETDAAKLSFDSSYTVNETAQEGVIMASIASDDMAKIIIYQEYASTPLPFEELVASIDANLQAVEGVKLVSEETVQISGVDALKKSYTMEIEGETVLQTNYAMQNGDNVIIQMATAYDEDGMVDLEKIITATELK